MLLQFPQPDPQEVPSHDNLPPQKKIQTPELTQICMALNMLGVKEEQISQLIGCRRQTFREWINNFIQNQTDKTKRFASAYRSERKKRPCYRKDLLNDAKLWKKLNYLFSEMGITGILWIEPLEVAKRASTKQKDEQSTLKWPLFSPVNFDEVGFQVIVGTTIYLPNAVNQKDYSMSLVAALTTLGLKEKNITQIFKYIQCYSLTSENNTLNQFVLENSKYPTFTDLPSERLFKVLPRGKKIRLEFLQQLRATIQQFPNGFIYLDCFYANKKGPPHWYICYPKKLQSSLKLGTEEENDGRKEKV